MDGAVQEISYNASSQMDMRSSKREREQEEPLNSPKKRIIQVADQKPWTLEESNELKKIVQTARLPEKGSQWRCIRNLLEDKGIFKTTKQVYTRWHNCDDPKVISKIRDSDFIKILSLVSIFNKKWANISSLIKEHNFGYHYSDNAIKNFFNVKVNSKNHLIDSEKIRLFLDEYSYLSTEEAAIEIAKSLHLDRPEEVSVSSKTKSKTVKPLAFTSLAPSFISEACSSDVERRFSVVSFASEEGLGKTESAVVPAVLKDNRALKKSMPLEIERITVSSSNDGFRRPEARVASQRQIFAVSPESENELFSMGNGAVSSSYGSQGKPLDKKITSSSSMSSANVSPISDVPTYYGKTSRRWSKEESQIFQEIARTHKSEFTREPKNWTRISEILKSRGVIKSPTQAHSHWANIVDPYVIRPISVDNRAKVACLIEHLGASWTDISSFIAKYNQGYHYSSTTVKDLLKLNDFRNVKIESVKVWSQYSHLPPNIALEEIAKSLHLYIGKVDLTRDEGKAEENGFYLPGAYIKEDCSELIPNIHEDTDQLPDFYPDELLDFHDENWDVPDLLEIDTGDMLGVSEYAWDEKGEILN